MAERWRRSGSLLVVSGGVRLLLELLRWSGKLRGRGEVEADERMSGGGGMAPVPRGRRAKGGDFRRADTRPWLTSSTEGGGAQPRGGG